MKNICLVLLVATLLSMLYACAHNQSLPRVHPEEVKGLVDCGDCHTDRWALWNHRADDFYHKHRFFADEESKACYVCHQEAFCADCHAHKEEIKPSDKYKDEPERNLPHRGDYINQHKIDGRIKPAYCAKCHGRPNNERCRSCHR